MNVMNKRPHMRKFPLIAALLAFGVTLGSGAAGQSALEPVIRVNDGVITAFELDQRQRMLAAFRTPGDLTKAAREGLIDDRLKQQEMRRTGLQLKGESLDAAMVDFAGRANMSLDQFLDLLATNGVEKETLRDFVEIGITWRDFVRGRFNGRVTVSDADVDRAIRQTGAGGSEIEVLLNEIIIPAPPPEAAQAMATAERISKLTSTSAFEAEARRVSALPSAPSGGVTAPLSIPNGVALFQLRDVREVPAPKTAPTAIDYATFYLAGGLSETGLRAARSLADSVDTCDDLYGLARGRPATVLDRQSLAPSDIPQDIALELARLDADEYSYNLTSADGQTLMFIMLCGRTTAAAGEVDPATVRNQLRSQRLAGYAEALLEDLRATALITGR